MADSSSTNTRIPFTSLPLDPSGPHGNAWGKWGADDQLGTLNYLTDDVVAAAARENVRSGQRVSLNWSLAGPTYPRFARKTLSIKSINKAPLKHAHDDEWSFNSQCSSQWDGFRHYAYQEEGLYYMGRKAEEFASSSEPNGIQHVSHKGIASRAILIDWYSWALQSKPNASEIDTTTAHAVPFSEILQTLESQNMRPSDIRRGDILIIRFGYLRQYADMCDAKRAALDERYKTHKPDNIGVEPSRELLEFLWEKEVAAVAGDARSFEVWPCAELEWHLHEWLLAGWGMPIGELFDLEELARVCGELGRWSFFLTSAVMNAPGAVASPPNALAFF